MASVAAISHADVLADHLLQLRAELVGLGAFYLGLSDEDLLKGLNVGDGVGGDLFYNVAVTPWFHVILDAQGIDSALPRAETAWVLGVRTHFNL
jgi:porin